MKDVVTDPDALEPGATITAKELGPLELRPLEALGHYHPRWVGPPDFRGTWTWQALRDDIQAHGLRDPLVILADGRVLDGDHRYTVAQELGLDPVPVRVARLPLPLSEADQLRVETYLVQQALARRQLTRHQIDALLLDLELARLAVDRAVARRQARLANLRQGSRPGQPLRAGPTIDALARATGLSPRHIKELLVVAHRGTRELHDRLRRGAISVKGAYRTLQHPATPPPPAWQAEVGALVADGYTLIEHILDLASGSGQWSAARREQCLQTLQSLADALAERRRQLDPDRDPARELTDEPLD